MGCRKILGWVISMVILTHGQSPAAAAMSGESLLRGLVEMDVVQYEFMQFGPRGEQATGTVKIDRPGRIRFEYDPPSPLSIIADGRSLAVNNRKLGTWTLYPLERTPFGMLLSDRLDPKALGAVQTETSQDVTTVVLSKTSASSGGDMSLLFDSTSGELRQWTVVDGAGNETVVILNQASTPGAFEANTFRIPYSDIRKQ